MFSKENCPQEYCRVDSDKCIAKTDSSNEEKNTNTKPDNKNSIITPSLTSPAQSINKSIQENIDQTCQTTCESLAKKLDSPKIINLDKPACRDMCKQIIEAKCKTFETQQKTSQVTVSCNDRTCNYTCKLIEKEKPTINCTEFGMQECLAHTVDGCKWTNTGCK